MALPIESVEKDIFNGDDLQQSFGVWSEEERKSSTTVVGLDFLLGLSKVRWCSLNQPLKCCFFPPEYCTITV